MKTKILSYIGVGLMWVAAVTVFVSCSDTDLDQFSGGSDEIRFKIARSESWTQGGSRSEEGTPNISSRSMVALVSDCDSLYLSVVDIPGFNSSYNPELSRSTTVVSADDIQSFGVYATRSESDRQLYMSNVEVTQANGWQPEKEYLWPGDGSLHFNAYSPYVAAGSSEGIVSVPEYDASGALTLDYLVPAEVKDQIDLMRAESVDASASPCALTFDHMLTAVRFVAGSELSPCTISEIKISGIASQGSLDLESGEWSEISGDASYSVTPGLQLAAATGSKYVAAGVSLTADDDIFILMPQTLPDGAKIILTIDVDGKSSVFEASLAGQKWVAGHTVTYRLSASPDVSSLIFTVTDTDGNSVNQLNAKYTGSNLSYIVKSYYSPDGTTMQPVDWDASFVDADGNIMSQMPDWITNYTKDGNGETECTMTTDMTVPVFLQMSDATKTLRNTADVNNTSGHDYYNLSNSTGAEAVENTANCYLINAPGKYSLPLVYGNAVKDGATNSSAYVSTLTDNRTNERNALLKFINHLGNAITDPYIYNNAGCEPYDAVLVWEEKIGLVRNVSLSADKKSIEFELPADFIRQGNADVAVRDKNGTVMWSWQLWVTDFVNGSDWYTVPVNGKDYHLYPHTMGRVNGGDCTQFKADSITMRLTQKNVPDGVEPMTRDIKVQLGEKIINTNSYYSFYQWGRKDPMVSAVNQFYDGDRNEINASQLPQAQFGSDHKAAIEEAIMHPDLFQTGSASDLSMSVFYINLWDIDDVSMKPNSVNDPNIKTVYDPCPVGAKVPVGNEFFVIKDYDFTYDVDAGTVYVTLPSGRRVDFAMLGYRDYQGTEVTSGVLGGFWTAVAAHRSKVLAEYFHIQATTGKMNFETNSPLFGFGIRPVMDE